MWLEQQTKLLSVSVRGPGETQYTTLSPRQLLSLNGPAAVSALTCPHSHFGDYWSGSSTGYGLIVQNLSTGDGIRAYSSATSQNYGAIFAYNMAATGYGTGVYGASTHGNGVFAYSANADAIEATSDTTTKSAIYAHSVGGNGVWGISTNKEGVHGGSTSSYGVDGTSTNSYGVYGTSTESYGGYFYSTNYRALYVSGVSGLYAAMVESRGGSGAPGLYVNGALYVTGAKTGYVD